MQPWIWECWAAGAVLGSLPWNGVRQHERVLEATEGSWGGLGCSVREREQLGGGLRPQAGVRMGGRCGGSLELSPGAPGAPNVQEAEHNEPCSWKATPLRAVNGSTAAPAREASGLRRLGAAPRLVPLCRFDSNASASSSSGDGDSDRDDKKPAKKAKIVKDRKPRKKQPEVRGCRASRSSSWSRIGRVTAPPELPHLSLCSTHQCPGRSCCPGLASLPPDGSRLSLSQGHVVPVASLSWLLFRGAG